MYSEKSSLGVTGGVALNLSPKAAFSTFSAVATTAASLTTALIPSAILISGAGAFAMAATALAVRSIPSCILVRTSGLKVLMVPSRTASSGMMLAAVPAWSEPMETTPNSVGSFSRLMTLCTSTTKRDAIIHWIDGRLWHCAMAAAAFEFDVEAVGIGRADPDPVVDIAVGKGPVMQGKAGIGLGKAREQAVGQHGFRTRTHFLGGLGDEHQRALPLMLQPDQRLRRSDPARHVDVVAAAMGDKGFAPLPNGLVAACVGQAGLLLHRQRVKLGAHHDGRTVAIFVERNQPGLADLLCNLEADRAHLGGEFCGGLLLLEGDLGMGVDVLVERIEFWIFALEGGLDRLLQACDVELRMRRQRNHAAQGKCGEQGLCKPHGQTFLVRSINDVQFHGSYTLLSLSRSLRRRRRPSSANSCREQIQ